MLCENGCNDGGGPFEYTNRKAVNGMDQERKWIREVQRHRSQTAADHLIRAHYDEIYRFVYRQTGHMEDAMDLTQDIFLAVLRAIHTYDEGKAAFRTWLFRIAANKVIDARRRARPPRRPWRTKRFLWRRILQRKWPTAFSWIRSRPTSRPWMPRPRPSSAFASTGREPSPRLLRP